MASIIGGIGTSHVPTIGVAYDKGKQQDPVWKPLFDGYTPVAAWLAEQRADVLVFFYNDHCTTFFFDLYPTFALGVGERFPVADEGAGLRNLPPIRGDVQLQAHIAECLVNDEFDLTVFQDKPIDHGCAAPLPLLWPHVPDWPGTVVPIAINVLQFRCRPRGAAIAWARRCAARSNRIRKIFGWWWWAPVGYPTRSMANAPGSTTPNGTWNFWTGSSVRPRPSRISPTPITCAWAVRRAWSRSCGWRCAARWMGRSASCIRTTT